MFSGHRIAVCIPAYNVAEWIQPTLQGIPSWVDLIVVVDDASTDRTAESVREVQDSRIKLITHDKNRGVGGAMKTGFRAALEQRVDVVVKIDGDHQMDPKYLPALLDPIVSGSCEMTKGNRFGFSEGIRTMPLVRWLGNQGLTFLNKFASGYWHVFDPQNGFIAIHAKVLRRANLEALADDYFFENSLLIEINPMEARVSDIFMPARYQDEPSSMNLWKILFSFPHRLVYGFFRRVWLRYFYRDFSAVAVLLLGGTALFGGGVVFSASVWYYSHFSGNEAMTGTIALGLAMIILGFPMLLQSLLLDIHQTPVGDRKHYDFTDEEIEQLAEKNQAYSAEKSSRPRLDA